jgi:hypothetical protein
VLVAAAVAAVVAGPAAAAPRVMTQNPYLGADLAPTIQAAIACSAVPAPADCPARALLANEAAWAQVRATDFPARAKALARVIDDDGTDARNRALSTAGLLWPSDHAGVVAEPTRP